MQHTLLDRLGRQNGIDCSRAPLDSGSIAAKKGEATGPNPTVRGKPGTKHRVSTDANGTPLAMKLTPRNVRDSRMPEAVKDAVPPIR